MSEQLLTVLKLCLLALLYIFFLRVLQAVWSEVRGPRPNQPSRPQKAERQPRQGRNLVGAIPALPSRRPAAAPVGSKLVMVEPPEIAGTTFEVGDELTMGRSAGCQITLDDTYVSQLHTRVFRREGRYFVEDLGSTNGTYLNRNKVAAPTPVNPGDRIQVGSTVLELV